MTKTIRQLIGQIPVGTNIILTVFFLGINLLQFFYLPLVLLPQSLWFGLLIFPLALLNNSLWAITHEAIHGIIHPNKRINYLMGVALATVYGSPFSFVRAAHLLHHRHNRRPFEATEIYDSAKVSKEKYEKAYYAVLFGGLYLFEALSYMKTLLPKKTLDKIMNKLYSGEDFSALVTREFNKAEDRPRVRKECWILLVFQLAVLWSYGWYFPFLILIVAMRALCISFFDNIYHYDTPLNDVNYSEDLELPSVVSSMLLSFNFHYVHHKYPTLPWIHLRKVFKAEKHQYKGRFFRKAKRQLEGISSI